MFPHSGWYTDIPCMTVLESLFITQKYVLLGIVSCPSHISSLKYKERNICGELTCTYYLLICV